MRVNCVWIERGLLLIARESVCLFYREDIDSFSLQRRECLSSLQRGGRLLLSTKERVYSFITQRRLLLSARERLSLSSIEERLLLSADGREIVSLSLFSIERRQAPSLYTQERERLSSR